MISYEQDGVVIIKDNWEESVLVDRAVITPMKIWQKIGLEAMNL